MFVFLDVITSYSIHYTKLYDAQQLAQLPQMTDRFELVDYQPTCENMLLDFVKRIQPRLSNGVTLHSLKLNETANSFAEWFA